MAKLLNWIKTAGARVFDPNREERISTMADQIWQQIVQQKRQFDYRTYMASMDADVEDMPLVAERVYENALAKAWKDYQLTPQERESLAVIAALVQIAPARATE